MKVMRVRRHAKLIILLFVMANLILFYFCWKSTLWKTISGSLNVGGDSDGRERVARGVAKSHKDKIRNANKHIRKSITIIFRSFYTFENDLRESIESILEVVPNMPILVLQDGVPYPPIQYEQNRTLAGGVSTVQFFSLGFDVQKRADQLNPLTLIRTKYVLIMPDSVRISNKNLLQKILKEINSVGSQLNGHDGQEAHFKMLPRSTHSPEEVVRRLIIVPFAGNIKTFSSCLHIELDVPNWTIQYSAVNSSDKCDLYLQKHAILTDIGVIREMAEPFGTPFPELFYIQAKVMQLTRTIYPHSFQDGRRLFAAYHTKQRRMDIRRKQFKEMYKKLQIKRIIRHAYKVVAKTEARDTSSNPQYNLILDTQFSSSNFSLPSVTEIDLIGCERTTKSCIGTVYDNQPFYIYMGKHTPPCCLEKLKMTFHHVLDEFENVGIRYWLDNNALLMAIETNQLSPDAYDIDISFNVQDLERSNSLKKSQSKPFMDNEGFYWIKATDGHYFRVQFSKVNQIGVNLLPFEENGNQVKPNGFFGWKAHEFSADYLHPMSTVLFLGKQVMCPNNVREFLEQKKLKVN